MDPREYRVGWICALSLELTASRAMLDKIDPPIQNQDPHDRNNYIFGELAGHKVVMACLPAGRYGINSAAPVAINMLRSFPWIKFGLMVGIGGGVPSKKHDIWLGDVVVSMPGSGHGGVINYDMGKVLPGGGFEKKNHLNEPPTVLLQAVSSLRATHDMENSKVAQYITEALQKWPKLRAKYARPGPELDKLFEKDCEHANVTDSCDICGPQNEISRDGRVDDNGEKDDTPNVHYGLIGSGQKVIASTEERNRLCKMDDILCFEMEASGLMNDFPCLVVRGISDYADAYKRDDWQPYAAAAAAAYAKELLQIIPRNNVDEMEDASKKIAAITFTGANSGIQIGQNFGDVATTIGGLTINYSTEARLDYSGNYSLSSLRPVASYIQRLDLQARLKQQLSDNINKPQGSSLVLGVYGLGGAGKTQLVLKYLQENRKAYAASFWIEAGSTESIERDFVHIHRRLYNEQQPLILGSISAEDAIIAVKSWFHIQKGTWLFVFDNADNIDHVENGPWVDIARFIPDSPNVQVVVTTRSSSIAKMSTIESIEVGTMTLAEAKDLLIKSARLKDSGQTDMVESIVRELDFLPLAINLAGDYIWETPHLHNNLKEYLEEFRARRKAILDQQPEKHIHFYSRSVLTTWETSFETVEKKNSAAARFLTLLAFLQSEDIYLDLFEHEIDDDKGRETDQPLDRLQWHSLIAPNEAVHRFATSNYMRLLSRFSFVRWDENRQDKNRQHYAMHKLVHAWGHDRLSSEDRRKYSAAAMQIVYRAIPPQPSVSRDSDEGAREENTFHESTSFWKSLLKTEVKNTPEMRERLDRSVRLIPHILANYRAFEDAYQNSGEVKEEILDPLWQIASFVQDMSRIADSIAMWRFLLSKYRSLFGDEHDDTLMAMNSLAVALLNLGEYNESLSILQEVVARRRRTFEDKHRNTLRERDNLAQALRGLDRYEDACSAYQEVLRDKYEMLGEDHTDTLTSMHNLAEILSEMGRPNEAVELLEKCVEKCHRIFGENHPDTSIAMGTLAGALSDAGRHKEAMEVGKRVVNMRKAIFGEVSFETLRAMMNLGSYLGDNCLYKEAIDLKTKASDLLRQTLGNDNSLTLKSLNSLGRALLDVDQLDDAAALFEDVFATLKRLGRSESLFCSRVMGNLALVMSLKGSHQKVEALSRDVLQLQLRFLAIDHPAVLNTKHNIAVSVFKRGGLPESTRLFREVLEQKRKVLGDLHPHTFNTLECLADNLSEDGALVEAMEIIEDLLDRRSRMLGKDHTDTIRSINDLAIVLYRQGNFERALELQKDLLGRFLRLSESDDSEIITAMLNLSQTLQKLSRHAEATTMALKVSEMSNSRYGEKDPKTLRTFHNAACCLFQEDKTEEAIEMLRRAVAGGRNNLGDEDPNTIVYLYSLANLLLETKQYTEASQLYQEIFDTHTRLYGSTHHETLAAMTKLVQGLYLQGKMADAVTLQRSLCRIRTESFGPDHDDTLLALANLAGLLWISGNYEEAESLAREYIGRKIRLLGQDHRSTLMAQNGLARKLKIFTQKHAEAEDMHQEVRQKFEVLYGTDDSDTIKCISAWATAVPLVRRVDEGTEGD